MIFCFASGFLACSSSSSSGAGNGNGGGSGGDGNGSGVDGGGGGSSCVCHITFNGTEKDAACGQSVCIQGKELACASDGSGTSDEGACKSDAGSSGSDSGGGGGSTCVKEKGDCSFDGVCCSGFACDVNEVCTIPLGGACTSSTDCEGADFPVSPGADCQSGKCCGKTNYPCAAAGPDSACCSGTCSAPNGSGISFCE